MKSVISGVVVALGVLFLGQPAYAEPFDIGTLSFNLLDPSFPEFGGQIGIANLSSGILGVTEAAFDEITIQLRYADNSGSETYAFGGLNPGDLPSFILNGAAQSGFTFSSLSFLAPGNTIALDIADVTQFGSAYLSLLFHSTLIETTNLLALEDGAFAPIVYETETAAVPEPATLLLMGCGAVMAFALRKRLPILPSVS